MYAAGQIEWEDFYTKVNFSSLIMRFERENTDVLSFGSLLSFDAKINRIRETIMSYVTENETDSSTEDREPEPAGATS